MSEPLKGNGLFLFWDIREIFSDFQPCFMVSSLNSQCLSLPLSTCLPLGFGQVLKEAIQ